METTANETESTTESAPSYHDVVVTIDGTRHKIDDDYRYQLTCTKTGGWELWSKWQSDYGDRETLVGGEFYGHKEFRIEINGVTVCLSGTNLEDKV